ncbi:MAG: MipA/OmpV family protein [Gammaproteobacteria bacterium]|nr:MipA/OmpV family protein [Gammaproteobacteria bacterium]
MPAPRRSRARIHARHPCVLALLWPVVAGAQQPIGLQTTEPLELDPVADELSTHDWGLRLGLLGAVGPDFEGASTYEADPVPLLRVSWKNRVVFRGRSLDLNAVLVDGLRAGPMVKTRAGRRDSRAAYLRGLGDVDRAFEAGGFVRFKRGPFALRVNALQDFAGAHGGCLVETSAQLRLPLDEPRFSLTVSSTWVDDDYNNAYFGVDAVQARRSGLRRFDADGGFKDVGVALGTRVELSPHWSAVMTMSYRRLLGDTADSPIVADHGDADQFYAAVGALWEY